MTTPENTHQVDADVWAQCANELGEGPIAHPDRQTLLWFDILERRLFEQSFNGTERREHEFDVMASAAALVDQQRILVVTEIDLRVFDLNNATTQPVHPFLADQPQLRSNDCRVHPSGAFWISSMGKRAEAKAGAIWCFRSGTLKPLFEEITIPNAICFAEEGRTAYFSDSDRGTVWRVAVDPTTGLPEGEPVVFRQYGPDEGSPDGAVVDTDGRIWIAAWGASAVDVWNPDGTRFDRCALPVSQPTCPAFFGPDFNEMAVTSARENMSAEALAAEPHAGSVLKLRRKVHGFREPVVQLS